MVIAAWELSAGRAWSLVGAALGIVGVVFGVSALARLRGALVAVALGTAGVVIGAVVVLMAEGGPGTGYGIVGGYVSAVVGLAGVVLGVLARRKGALAAGRRAS